MNGSVILPTEENLREFLGLFESYTVGSLHGFCLLAEPPGAPAVGCVLVGEEPGLGLHLKTTIGRLAMLWGVYVEPEWRRRGVAWKLQDDGMIHIQGWGFDTVSSQVLLSSPEAEGNAFSWPGGAQRYATTILVDLRGHTDG